MNTTLIMYYIQWYNYSIISYRLTFIIITSSNQHPKFLSDSMIIPVTISIVRPFSLTMASILLNIYSRI